MGRAEMPVAVFCSFGVLVVIVIVIFMVVAVIMVLSFPTLGGQKRFLIGDWISHE